MSKPLVYKAPNRPEPSSDYRIFLAGSIENGKAEDWQSRLTEKIEDPDGIVIYNPRREKWDPNMEQSINNPIFMEQVSWELEMLENADLIYLRLLEDTISPISLLELGLFHASKMIVCCDPKYFRRANVQIVCQRYGIEYHESEDTAIASFIKTIKTQKTLKSLS